METVDEVRIQYLIGEHVISEDVFSSSDDCQIQVVKEEGKTIVVVKAKE